MSAKYTHDCKKCEYLETSGGYDWYFCTKGVIKPGSVIGRFGDPDRNYFSSPIKVLYKMKSTPGFAILDKVIDKAITVINKYKLNER